jgi:hypothetical protein
MKTKFKAIGILFAGLMIIGLTGCKYNDVIETPTADQYKVIRDAAIKSKTQKFSFNVSSGTVTLTSKKGVKLTINGAALTNGRVAATGKVNVEYIELFDKGNMLITNKPTMGLMENGDKALLKSGGMFYVKLTQDGDELFSTEPYTLKVPATKVDNEMTLWVGDVTDPDNLVWKDAKTVKGGGLAIDGKTNMYTITFGNFGWTNIDKFFRDPRPKTTMLVAVPDGYDNTNCSVYLSYDGEGQNALAKLDTYTSEGLFSEHYGQIPIGLACHIIFSTVNNGHWTWAIKPVTITAETTYTFTVDELVQGTEAQLVAAVNAIQ